MHEPLNMRPMAPPTNYLPYVMMTAFITMVAIAVITIWGPIEKTTEIITLIGAFAGTIIAALIGLMTAASQKMGVATHNSVNSVVAKWKADTEEATRIAKVASEAAVASALIEGKAEGMATQLIDMRKLLDSANAELAKIAEMRRLMEGLVVVPTSAPPIAAPPIVIEEKK